MKTLKVLYSGWDQRWPLGTLAESGGRVYFEYTAQALEEGLELSPLRCPLRREAYDRLPGFVADALPDGWGLFLMDKLFRQRGVSPAGLSALDRLAYIGSRSMGGLAFEPEDAGAHSFASLGLTALAEESRKLVNDEGSEALAALAYWGGSPHGARPKVLVQYDPATNRISNDPQSAGEPWLVKFPAGNEHPEVCAIEALYADLARRCGLEFPEHRHFEITPQLSAFAVRRFDRRGSTRVPTLTLAGALEVDYRIPSAVDYTGYLRLTRYLTRDEEETRKAFRRCVFNVVFHNRDDHPKNHSYCLTEGRRWTLSPAYDLTFSEGPGGEHHMDVCGQGRAPSRNDLQRLGKESDIKASVVEEILGQVGAVAETFGSAASEYPIRRATVEAMVTRVDENLRRVVGGGLGSEK